jgi:hypothetical protein
MVRLWEQQSVDDDSGSGTADKSDGALRFKAGGVFGANKRLYLSCA